MVLAGDTIFVAGPPDVLDEEEAFNTPFEPETVAKIAEQDAAYEGKRGALLMAVSKSDGKELLKVDLPVPPVWDGMIAAGGRLYVATKDGCLRCMGEK